jgi:HNH endonuclease
MPRQPRYTEHEVREAVASSRSMAQALTVLGLRAAGGNFRTLKKLIDDYGIPIDHFWPKWTTHPAVPRTAMPLGEILVEHSRYHRGDLKRRLYDRGLKERRCEMCGQTEQWHGRQMALILDHINGVADDNRLENLRIVCPNCAATLDTHCGRKNRSERTPRACLHCGCEFTPRYGRQRYCSRECGVHSKGPCDPRPKTRKVDRPSYDQLKADLESMSVLAVGRKYGVSDNAVRKWLRWYERQAEREERSGDCASVMGEETDTISA